MSDFEKTPEQWEAFQKIWLETFSKLGETAFSFNPQSAPPDVLRQMRSGILQALGKSWEEYLRSPQFLDGMKQWMDNALQFRKLSSDFISKARQDSGAAADNESVLEAIGHLERRLLNRIEEVADQVNELSREKRPKPNAARVRPKTTPTRGKRKRS